MSRAKHKMKNKLDTIPQFCSGVRKKKWRKNTETCLYDNLMKYNLWQLFLSQESLIYFMLPFERSALLLVYVGLFWAIK